MPITIGGLLGGGDPLNISGDNSTFENSSDPLYLWHNPDYGPNPAAGMQRSMGRRLSDDFQQFLTEYKPLFQQQMARLRDTSLVKQAGADAATTEAGTQQRRARDLGRYSASLSTAQRTGLDRGQTLSSTAATSNTINNARIEQVDRNTDAAISLASMGNEMRNQGMDNMLSGMGIASNRAQGNRQARANATSQNQQTGATIASAVLMFM